MAPTRLTAALLAHAERSGAKVIAAGDVGQLPSVQAGGWFDAVTRQLGAVQLREVMRQRDPDERAALEALHDGRPDVYLGVKQQQRALRVHAGEPDALAILLRDWDQARTEHGLTGAVMIARDNTARALLNEAGRAALKRDGSLTSDGVTVAGREFCVGDRVIARRNDRYRDIDNGTRATITAINPLTRALTIEPDGGSQCVLDAHYVAEHLEHAYALTGHAAQARRAPPPAQALASNGPQSSRAQPRSPPNGPTPPYRAPAPKPSLRVIAEPSPARREREQYAPPEPTPTFAQALHATHRAMKRPEAEQLAVQQAEPQELPTTISPATERLQLNELAEAGAEHAHHHHPAPNPSLERRPTRPAPPEPDWRALRRVRQSMTRGPSIIQR